jgi:UDP-GlcNAc3NAcA epimerase
MRLVSVVGARPQFIKLAPLVRAIREHNDCAGRCIEHVILHTGQHHDPQMSAVFFRELGIPEPAVNLGISGGSPTEQVGRMLQALQPALAELRPDRVVVFGDTNSTLAGALAAAQAQIGLAHVEAGLRSYDRRMPEEINRVVADVLADVLFCPTSGAVANLAAEGICRGVHLVGDIMYDALLAAAEQADGRAASLLAGLGISENAYYLATVHRAENTDEPQRLRGIFSALSGCRWPVVLPLHPRTRKALGSEAEGLASPVRAIAPVGYLEMVALARSARIILTDSGGLQKEAYFHRVPCVTLRSSTEWPELVEAGCNRLAGAEPGAISAAIAEIEACGACLPDTVAAELYGDGRTARRIVEILSGS